MKTLFDISNLLNSSGGGIHYHLKGLIPALIKEMEKNNDEIEFLNIYFRNKPVYTPDYIQSNKLHSFRFPVKLLNQLWMKFNIPNLKWFYKDFDIVHSPHFSLPIMSRTKKILTVHDITYLKHPEYFDIKYKRINDYGYKQLLPVNLQRVDHIIAISDFTRNDIIDYFNISPDKVTTVYTGVDKPKGIEFDIANRYLKKYDLIADEYIYFPAGTLEHRKNIKRTIKAFNTANIPDNMKLVISGIGETSFLNLEKNDRVICLKWNLMEERDILYQNSLFVVYPSLYEGFGMPIIEAMANKKAVISSNTTSLNEIAGDFAYKVNPESIDELINGFNKLIDYDYRTKLEKKSLNRANDFSWQKMAEEIFKIYEKTSL